MSEYKCICCGEFKESEKECSCSKCGYKMYLSPFDRSQILIREIKEFVRQLRVLKNMESFLSFYREIPKKGQNNQSNKNNKKVKLMKCASNGELNVLDRSINNDYNSIGLRTDLNNFKK